MADTSRVGGERGPSENGSLIGKVIARLQGLVGAKGDPTLRESIEDALEEHTASEESLTTQERLMLINILSFDELRVDDVMVPRADIVAVGEDVPLNDVLATFAKAAHSRLPVYRETLDDPVGMYHIKDVIRLLLPNDKPATEAEERQKLMALRRPVLFAPPSMPAIDLLVKMQTQHIHLALVIDEYGGTYGLVSIENLVERIVGDLEDKPDESGRPMLVPLPQGGFDADARLDIDVFERELAVDVVPDEREELLDTLGGLVVSLVGRVPQRGEIISHPKGLEFEVLDADPRRLKRLRVRWIGGKGAKGGKNDSPPASA